MAETKTKELTLTQIGVNEGYLQNKKVILKPVSSAGKMIKDKDHSSYFMIEGAQVSWCIPKTQKGHYAKLFKDENERDFFEKILKIDLNPLSEEGSKFYKKTKVKFLKNPSTMFSGETYDLMNPVENLNVRILKAQDEIAPSWETRKTKPYYKFALVDENYEDEKKAQKVDLMQKIYMFMGSIMNSQRRMSEFLEIYLMTIRSPKVVPETASIDWLKSQLDKIIESDKTRFVALIDDPKIDAKMFILQALKVGAIQKQSIGTYIIPEIDSKYTFTDLVDFITDAKGVDDIYFKIEGQINASK